MGTFGPVRWARSVGTVEGMSLHAAGARRPLRSLPVGLVLVVLGLGGALAGCSGDDSGGDAASKKPAVCDSVSALKSAGADLKDMSVRSDGVGGIQDQVAKVQSAFADVKTDAADQFGTQVDTVDSALATLKDNVSAAVDNPGLTTLADVGTGVRTLADDVNALVDDVQNTC